LFVCFVMTLIARETCVELLHEFLGVYGDEPLDAVASAFGSSDPWKGVGMEYVTDTLTDVSVDPDDYPQAGKCNLAVAGINMGNLVAVSSLDAAARSTHYPCIYPSCPWRPPALLRGGAEERRGDDSYSYRGGVLSKRVTPIRCFARTMLIVRSAFQDISLKSGRGFRQMTSYPIIKADLADVRDPPRIRLHQGR
jgi:hypothetical protein